MSDDLWRPGQDDDFGDLDDEWDDIPAVSSAPPLPQRERPTDLSGPVLSFGGDDSAAMPHWSEPPTGEIPRLFADREPTDDLDVWSSFSAGSAAPVWRDEPEPDATRVNDFTEFDGVPRLGALDESEAPADPFFDIDDDAAASPAARREPMFERPAASEPSMSFDLPPAPPMLDDETIVTPVDEPPARGPIRIGTDSTGGIDRPAPPRSRTGQVTGATRRSADPSRRQRAPEPPGAPRSGRPAPPPKGGTKGRDMPTAIAVGFVLAAVFLALIKFAGPPGVLALVCVVMGLAAVEFFGRVTERGYRPASVPGIAACALLPIAAYHYGERGIAVCVFMAMVAAVVSAITADGVESGPLPNTAMTMLGVLWIGVLGSFAGLILAQPKPIGTDTIFALAIGVVANDVGALFVGSAAGRTPLRDWISPNKTMEGFLGGFLLTLGAMWILNIVNGKADTWPKVVHLLILGVIVAILAPIGDLTESMFKRNLEVKDFGTLIPGHGGVLDRFDGFLFVLPAAYYVLTWLEPYLAAAT